MDEDETASLVPRQSRENSRSWRTRCSLSCRYSLALTACLGFCVVFSLRVNLSVALVAMVNTTDTHRVHSLQNFGCTDEGLCNVSFTDTAQKERKFHWNEETQGIILGAFYYGYIVTQIPGGWLVTKIGGKHTFGLAVLCTAILTLLTPLAANHGVSALITIRVLEGLALGVTFPSILELWSSWAPPLERTRLTTISSAGCSIGNIITQPIAGLLCASGFLGGWPSVFYILGSFGILWYVSWVVLVYEKPASHPRITQEEKEYILTSIGNSQDKVLKSHPIPWLAILTSPAVYAIIIGNLCTNWEYYMFLNSLPSYLNEVLRVKILEDSIISSIPYLVTVICQLVASVLGDWLLCNGSSVTDVRKVFTFGGFDISACVVPACLLIAVSYVGSDDLALVIILLSAILGFGSFTDAGFAVNPLDIAPRYAGLITGLSNGIGTISGFVAPLVTGWLTNGKPTRHQWQKVFYIAAIIRVLAGIGFVVLGKGEEQSWNTPNDEALLPNDTVEQERNISVLPEDKGCINHGNTSSGMKI